MSDSAEAIGEIFTMMLAKIEGMYDLQFAQFKEINSVKLRNIEIENKNNDMRAHIEWLRLKVLSLTGEITLDQETQYNRFNDMNNPIFSWDWDG